MSRTLRAGALVVFVILSAVVWVVYRTFERQEPDQAVAHTQEVLTAIERCSPTPGARKPRRAMTWRRPAPDPLERAERTLDTDVAHLATLTRANPTQQAKVQQLRRDASRTLVALRSQVEATRGGRAASRADAETARASMGAARATLQAGGHGSSRGAAFDARRHLR